jgi:beta-lactamase class A
MSVNLPRTSFLRIARQAAALALAFALPWAAQAAELRDALDPRLQKGLEKAVQELSLQGAAQRQQLAVALVDVTRKDAPRLAMINGDHMMYAASLPKVGILVGALAEAEKGRLPLDDEHLQAMNRMIRVSSNADATRVLNWVGGERLLETLQSDRFRFYDAKSGGGLWVGKAYGSAPAFRRDPVNNLSHGATAYQVARLYTMLADGTLFSPRLNALMMDILGNPGIHHKFVRALEGLPDVKIFRKSGTWRQFHADSALVEAGGHRYVIVGLAEHPDGGQWLVQLGRRMHELVVAGKPQGGDARQVE